MDIVAIILAAGNASRMGSIKQLLPYKNSTLLQFSIKQALNLKVKQVYCVLGANANLITPEIEHNNITIIHNTNWANGLSTSISAAISNIQEVKYSPSAVLVMLADQPKVDSNFLNKLIDIFEQNPDKIVASVYKTNTGVPAIFPAKYFNDLKALKGDKGAKGFLKRNQENIIKYFPNEEDVLKDIDLPEDYKKLLNKPS